MKGVILAGGLATRLYPLTHATNKHLLPVYDKPMIFYPIQTLVEAGIKDVLVVVSGPHSGHFINVLKNGKELGLNHLEYAYQENPKGGIADALKLAEDFADGQNLAVILGDNTMDAGEELGGRVREFKNGAAIFMKQVPDPERFGVVKFKGNTPMVEQIIEKPKDPPSDWAVTGLYFYDNTVFDKIRTLTPSARGELEITDVNNLYLKNKKLIAYAMNTFWSDAGTFDTLFQANEYWAKKSKKTWGDEIRDAFNKHRHEKIITS